MQQQQGWWTPRNARPALYARSTRRSIFNDTTASLLRHPPLWHVAEEHPDIACSQRR